MGDRKYAYFICRHTAKGGYVKNHVNSVCMFFDNKGNFIFINVGWTGKATEENIKEGEKLTKKIKEKVIEFNKIISKENKEKLK